MKIASLVFPIKRGQVLLGKKQKKIGANMWNGYGGIMEDGEIIFETAVRELEQELGLQAHIYDLNYCAKIESFIGRQQTYLVHVFLLERWTGKPQESSEMKEPTWFPFDAVPYSQMLKADQNWLPLVLAGKTGTARVHYNNDITKFRRFSWRQEKMD